MDIRTLLIVIHLIGLALGVGGASVTDVLIMNAVRSNQLTSSQFESLKLISKIIIVGLGLLVASGIGFIVYYGIVNPEFILSHKLYAKLTIVAILAANAIVLHHATMPILETLLDKPLVNDIFKRNLTLFFTAGGISVISWYSALFLGAWKNPIDLSYGTILGIYGALLVAAIIGSNIMGRIMISRIKPAPPTHQ